MITNDASEEAVYHQTLLGAKPIASTSTLNSLFDTFKIRKESVDCNTSKNVNVEQTVVETALDMKTDSQQMKTITDNSQSMDVLAKRVFTAKNT